MKRILMIFLAAILFFSSCANLNEEEKVYEEYKPEVDYTASPGATGISGLHSRCPRGDRRSSRVEAKNPALLSNRDGYLLELSGWTQGSQAS